MRDLYDQLLAGREGAIAQLVAEGRQENVSLEFKTKANPANGGPTKEDRQNLARALSAFSNSMGGVDLWEVYSVGPHSSPDPANWRTELNRPLAN